MFSARACAKPESLPLYEKAPNRENFEHTKEE